MQWRGVPMSLDIPKSPREWDQLPFLTSTVKKKISDILESSFGSKSELTKKTGMNGIIKQGKEVSLQPRLIIFFGPDSMGIRDIIEVIKERVRSKVWDAEIYNDTNYLDLPTGLRSAIEFGRTRDRRVLVFLGDLDSIQRGISGGTENWQNLIRYVIHAAHDAPKNMTFFWWCSSPEIGKLPDSILADLRNTAECIILSEPENIQMYEEWIRLFLKEDSFVRVKKLNIQKFALKCQGYGYNDIQKVFVDVTRQFLGKQRTVTKECLEDELSRKKKINWDAFQEAAVKLGAPPRPRPLPTRRWDELIGFDKGKIAFQYMWEKIQQGKGDEFNTLLLWGTPGCGKTEFGEIAVDVSGFEPVTITGSELIGQYIGETEARMNQFFDEIESKAEHSSVLVFIDEAEKMMVPLDASHGDATVFDKALVQTLKSRLGGIKDLRNVIFIASMNMPQAFDTAILRRFSWKVFISPPNKKGYAKLWRVYLQKAAEKKGLKVRLNAEDYEKLAELTTRKFLPSKINGAGGMINEIMDCCEKNVITYELCENVIRNKNSAEDQQTIRKYERHRDELPDYLPLSTNSALEKFITQHGSELGITATVEEILDLEEKEKPIPVFKDVVNMQFEKVNIYLICSKLLEDKGWLQGKPPVLLLWGPPGTGKTYLMRAAKNTLSTKLGKKIRFHLINGGEDITVERLVKEFEKAEASAPSILFLDEAEKILSDDIMLNPMRSDVVSRYNTLVQGLEQHEARFLIVLATNKPEKLDPRVISRIFYSLPVSLPSKDVIKKFWRRFLEEYCTGIDWSQVDFSIVADESVGIAPRNIEDACWKLKIQCDALHKKIITTTDIENYLSHFPREYDVEYNNGLQKQPWFSSPVLSRGEIQDYLLKNPEIKNLLNEDSDDPDDQSNYHPLPPDYSITTDNESHESPRPEFDYFTIAVGHYFEVSIKDLPGGGIQFYGEKIKGAIEVKNGDAIHKFDTTFDFFIQPSLPKGTILLPDKFIDKNRRKIHSGKQKIKLIFYPPDEEKNRGDAC